MVKKREPYNSEFCKLVNCIHRSGKKCTVEECIYNIKWIKYWEAYDVYPPSEES